MQQVCLLVVYCCTHSLEISQQKVAANIFSESVYDEANFGSTPPTSLLFRGCACMYLLFNYVHMSALQSSFLEK